MRLWGDDEPMVLDLVPWQVTLLLLVAVAALALMALDAPSLWSYR